MSKENEVFSCSQIELSENKLYLELENVVCYYNHPNGHGRQLDYGTTPEEQAATLEKAKTLVHMPLKAKYKLDIAGNPDLGGHEATRLPNGEMVFGTEKIGTHEEVWIEERDVTTVDGQKMHLPCLMARQRVWKDNKNVVAAIRRLFDAGNLKTSWELDVYAYNYNRGIKHLDDYAFLGVSLLGTGHKPAYGVDSQIISVASLEDELVDESELMIAEALSQDILDRKEVKEEMPNEEQIEVTAAEVSEQEVVETEAPAEETQTEEAQEEISEVPAEEEATQTEETEESEEAPAEETQEEVSAMTDHDIYRALRMACEEYLHMGWCEIAFNFPTEGIAWVHFDKMLDTHFMQVSYTVEEDMIRVTGVEEVALQLPIRDVNQTFASQQAQINQLTEQLASMSEIEAKYNAMVAEKEEAAHNIAVSELRNYVVKSGCFSEEELSEQSMQDMISGLKETELKVMISDRLLQQRTEAAEVSELPVKNEPSPKRTVDLEEDEKKVANRAKTFSNWLRSGN